MIQKNDFLLLPAVGYVRMSTDDQTASPARQKMQIKEFAEREGYFITSWYEDHGLTGIESANRVNFQRLLIDAKAGKFNALVLSELSRATREEPIEAMIHWRLLKQAGVKLLSVQKGGEYKFDDMGGLISLLVDQFGAHDEARKISNRTVSGKRKKLQDGTYNLLPTFGFDRRILDSSGNVVKTISFREQFQLPRGWKSERVITSEDKTVAGIRWAYQQLVKGKVNISDIRDEWNRRGIHTTNGRPWRGGMVKKVLTSSAMMGAATLGHREPRAKFESVVPEGEIAVVHHEPIVDKQLFELANRAIEAKSYSSKCPSLCYILKRKIICGHCGHKAHIKTARSGKKTPARSYQCHHAEYNPHCKVRLYVPADHIEKRVIEIIKEYVLCDENISDIRRNVDSVENHDPVEKMIETLNQNISQAGQNLALAQSRTEYNLISKSISEWEQQRDKLVKKRSSQIPEKAALTIDEVMHLRENIDKADPNAMAAVVDQVIDEIVLFQERLKPNVFFIDGILRFKEGVSDRYPEIKLTDEDICYQTAWKLLRKLFIEEKRALTRKEISQSLGVNADLAICSMRKLDMVECKRINNVMHYSFKS